MTDKEKKEPAPEKLLFQCGTAVITHSITQARILIQCGLESGNAEFHSKKEAIIPFLAKDGYVRHGVFTGFMRDARLFPSTMDTFTCGMFAKVAETATSSVTQTWIEGQGPADSLSEGLVQIAGKAPDGSYQAVLHKSTKEFFVKGCGLVISRPLYVLAVRQIASIFSDNCDSTLIAPLKDIILDGDLFAGLAPKLVYEAAVIYCGNSLVYLWDNYVKSDESDDNVQKLVPSLISMAVSQLFYPIHLVSTVQCIQGQRIVRHGHELPKVFPGLGWVDILRQLRHIKQDKRGNSILFNRSVASEFPPIRETAV